MESSSPDISGQLQSLRQIDRLVPANVTYTSEDGRDRVSLIIISLVEQLAAAYEPSDKRRRLLAQSICKSLVQMQVINPLFTRSELTGLRSSYGLAFLKMVTIARAAMPPLTNGTHLPALRGPDLYSDQLPLFLKSRYLSEFSEDLLLGRGGFGAVFKATNRLDQVSYAVKKIHMKLTKEKLLMKILREVTLLARLTHPNIVTYKTAWTEPIYNCTEMGKYVKCNEQDFCIDSSSKGSSQADGSCNTSDSLSSNGLITDWDEKYKDWYDDLSSVSEFKGATIEEVVGTPPSDWWKGVSHVVGKPISPTVSKFWKNRRDADDSASVIFQERSQCNPSWSLARINRNKASSCEKESSESNCITKDNRSIIFNDSITDSASGELILFDNPNDTNSKPTLAILYIQMELCQTTLRHWLDEREQIDERENFHIFRQLLLATEYLHSQGILHRDIKPRNIFMNSGMQVKLGDFGLAKEDFLLTDESDTPLDQLRSQIFSPIDSSGGVGTTAYAAPEQLVSGGCVNNKSDMYSLGVVLFEMCISPSTDMERVESIRRLREGSPGCLDGVSVSVGGGRIVDLIRQLTHIVSSERPGAQQLLSEQFTSKDLCLLDREREQKALKDQVELQQKQILKQEELINEQEKELKLLRNLLSRVEPSQGLD